MSIEIRTLSRDHIDAVHALFEAEFDALPYGTLNPADCQTFVGILSRSPEVSVGAFSGSRLIGFALCEVHPWSGAPEPFALSRLLPAGVPVGKVIGTLVDKNSTGRGLGVRLLHARRAALAEHGVGHAVGMMLTDNYSSIIAYMRSGGILCGFDHDDYDLLNFAHYSGELADRSPVDAHIQASEIDEMRDLFRRGYVCRRMDWDRSGDVPKPVYAMSAEFIG